MGTLPARRSHLALALSLLHPVCYPLKTDMRTLFTISLLCLCALLWAAISIARHIRTTKRRRRGDPRPPSPFNEVLFEGKQQQIRDHAAVAASQTIQVTPPKPQAPRSYPSAQAAARLAQAPLPIRITEAEAPAAKKAPQPVVFSREHQRLDWDYFNKDLGDLSDPYQPKSEAKDGTRRY